MNEINNRQKVIWLVTGVLAGIAIASIWPYEPGYAATNDRTKSIGLATMPVMLTEETEAVIVINYRTGSLVGGVLDHRTGKFLTGFSRNIAADFDVARDAEYAMVGAKCLLPNLGRSNMAKGVMYVAELRSGKVAAYGVKYNESSRKTSTVEMTPLDVFSFSDAIVD